MTTAATPERWVTAAVLAALAQHGLKAGDTVRATVLATWAPTLADEQRNRATTKLVALGFLSYRQRIIGGEREFEYTVTADGAAAITEAARGQVRKSGPKGTRRAPPPAPETYAARLWALLRIRKVLTAAEAAELLVDAGGPVDVRTATAQRYLRRWSRTSAVAESTQRVNRVGTSNGQKRYVLLHDSPTPPRRANAAGAAA